MHVMRYEDLKQDTVIEIEKTLIFLNVSYDSNTLFLQVSLVKFRTSEMFHLRRCEDGSPLLR